MSQSDSHCEVSWLVEKERKTNCEKKETRERRRRREEELGTLELGFSTTLETQPAVADKREVT